MDRIKKFLRLFRNFYFTVGLVALVWVLFFDRYNLIQRMSTQMHIKTLRSDLVFFKKDRDRIEETRNLMETDLGETERYAREKYLMKRENEDLFIIDHKGN
jgi:hypothetical protein